MSSPRHTRAVSDELFRAVYDSPASLPGRQRWLTPDRDVRKLEKLLGIPPDTIRAPLWLSGDRRDCPQCGRQISWLDIVSSALEEVHERAMIARVILGEQKFVNTEAPHAIAGVKCVKCNAPIRNIRSFKCHNWAYARQAMLDVLGRTEQRSRKR
jgi:hypothetical protein